ncbi:MAG: acetolactate decarboxylase [Synergistaceae bacterium]|nr:acetolactate decarboxylase [Synergistaceae bacterium]MBQ9403589.1 acetolactate decarboxylase [Synergistaceae bacterium]MBQ9595724.1 acetolactate decarboxylase [Synergistaceae bacterium]
MKKLFVIVMVVVLSLTAAYADVKSDRLFQAALLQSLMLGEYDGFVSAGGLKTYGDTGIGTFQSVNGELIMLDGVIYRALWDGSVEVVPDSETIPFANVTFFDSDIKQENINAESSQELKNLMTKIAAKHGKNQFYMAKVTGLMPRITVRSELPQKEPYKPLNDALKTDQREFTYENIHGTVVALYCPDYMDGLNTPGWHLHFISQDGKKGGHVLELAAKDCLLEMDVISEFAMIVPDRQSFNDKNLSINMKEAIQQVEGK